MHTSSSIFRAAAPRALALLVAVLMIVLAFSASDASAHHYDHLLAETSACGGSRQQSTSLSPPALALVMRCMHDQARTKADRKPLTWRSMLASSSDAKTADIVRCARFSHNACGRSTLYHVDRVGYTSGGCWGASENIAWGSGRQGSVRSIMSGWLHSDGHRSTILSTRYRDFGLGVRKGTFQGRSNAHVWTGHFGYRC